MAKLLKSVFIGLVLFGAAGAASWWWVNYGHPPANNEISAEPPQGQPARGDEPTDSLRRLSELPVAVRAQPATAEEIFRLGATLRKQQEALRLREESLEQEKVQLELVHEDLRSQQRELEGLLAQIQESIKAGDAVMAKLIDERQQLERERSAAGQQLQQINEAQSKQDDSQEANLKKVSEIVEAMEPDGAAAYFREAINAGKIETAVGVLARIEERDAAKILTAIGDHVLIAQLMNGVENMKRSQPKKRR